MSEKKPHGPRRRGQVVPRGPDTFLIRVPRGRELGKRIYHSETFHGSRDDADTRCMELLVEIKRGTYFQPSNMMVEKFFERWEAHLKRQIARDELRQVTFESYRKTVEIYLLPSLGQTPLSGLTPLVTQDAFDALADKGLASLTIRNARRILTRAMEQAVKWRLIAENPCKGIVTPKAKRKRKRAMDAQEAIKFLQEARRNTEDLIFVFVLFTGLRPVEFVGLRWQDLELIEEDEHPRGIAQIRKTIVRPKGTYWQWCEPKTENGIRDIYFPASLYSDLMAHKEKQEKQKRLMGREYHDHDLVFAASNGSPLYYEHLAKRKLRPLFKRAGLPADFTLYTLRRSFATLSTLAGASRLGRSAQMGHSSPDFTDEVYVTVLPSMKHEVSDKLESLLYGGTGTQTGTLEIKGEM